MSDLELETGNNAEEKTDLIATAKDLGLDRLKDFVGAHILEVKPGTTLLGRDGRGGNNFGGVFGRGVGTGVGVAGMSSSGHGVSGRGAIGVFGTSAVTGFAAVAGDNTGTDGFGVVGDARGDNGAGVLGRSRGGLGHGVRGEGAIGVHGTSSQTGFAAVAGSHMGEGYGVVGDAAGGLFTAGVLGRHALAVGVRGEGAPGVSGHCQAMGAEGGQPSGGFAGVRGKSDNGPGIFGAGRYGGQFSGTAAQLCLVPGADTGRPTTGDHVLGELFLDAAANVFICVGSGNPGTWVRLETTPA